MNRLRRVAVLFAVIGLLVLAVNPLPVASQTVPFKIGVLGPITGVAGVLGKSQVNAIKLRLKELNSEIGGRKVELVVEDSAGDPNIALTKARKLVERDGVNVLVGPLLSHVVAAVQDYVGQKGVPQMLLVGSSPEYTKYPTTFVPAWNSVQAARLLGQYAYQKLGYRRALVVSSSYVAGLLISDGFRAGFTGAGGTLMKEVYVPLGTADFAPYLTGLPAADTVFSFFAGADAIRYVKQRGEYGLRDRFPLLAIISVVDGMFLPAIGDAALGTVAIAHYLEDFTIQANRQFVEAYVKEYKEPPLGFYPALGYTIVQVLEEALNRTRGRSSPAELLEAMKRVDFQSTMGRFRFDPEKRFAILDLYILKVVRKDGRLAHEVVDVLREVKPE